MRRTLIVLVSILLFISCKKDDPLTIIEVKEYLPAYPGSYWEYSNGERISVHPEYVVHSYAESLNSTVQTSEVMVPKIGNEFLYEYSITQNSTVYPLKQLLSETLSSKWIVNDISGQTIYRETVQALDSMIINTVLDSAMYYDILIVVEYIESLGVLKWNTKEYYSKNIGLIRVDVNNPYDDIDPVIQKQLVGTPYINN